MKAKTLKGAALEYIVRNLLKSCGFTNVNADNLYTFLSSGNFYINGRGGAHDADVIMNPPFQMPFGYPTRLIFECKAYGKKVGIPIIRNAFGLKTDINEFEIVTKKSLRKRKNNRRASIAIENRNRYNYQVGIAIVNHFSKPAIEFAANNKLPLLSLSWFLHKSTIDSFNSITDTTIATLPDFEVKNLYDFFKDRDGDMRSAKYSKAYALLRKNNPIADFVTFANGAIQHIHIGILETGDIVFLYPQTQNNDEDILRNVLEFSELKSKLFYSVENPDQWKLKVFKDGFADESITYKFFLPSRLFRLWKKMNLDKKQALNIKRDYFSKILVFNKNNSAFPFYAISIDNEWMNTNFTNIDLKPDR